jgi:hypothetical protein
MTVNLIIKDRQKGKTTQLIYISEATRYPIVVPFEAQKKYIIELANQMHCSIETPLTIREMKEKGISVETPILFDNIESILGDAVQQYLGAEVFCATMTDALKEYYTNWGINAKE